MLLVEVKLLKGGSAREEDIVTLGTVVINRVGVRDDGRRADYRVRAFKKGDGLLAFRYGESPIREDFVYSHARKSLPVWSLVAKALKNLGYSR